MGKEAISYKGDDVPCHKFSGKLSDYDASCWIDEKRRLLKVSAEQYDYEFILADKEDMKELFKTNENFKHK